MDLSLSEFTYASMRAYFLDIPEYEALIYISSLRRVFYLIRPTLTTELRNRKMYTLVSYTNGFKKQKVNSESDKSRTYTTLKITWYTSSF
jgi:hypothetical protein